MKGRTRTPISRRTLVVAGVAGAVQSLQLASISGCQWTGKPVSLGTRVSIEEGGIAFTNAEGWNIELWCALVSIGGLAYFDDSEGASLGGMVEPTVVDLALGEVAIGDGDGVTGMYRSARFDFGPTPKGVLAEVLADAVVNMDGFASRGDAKRSFRFRASADDVKNAEGDTSVLKCAFKEAAVREDGAVTVTVRPSVWIDQVDFSLMPETGNTIVEVAPGSPPHQAFVLGLQRGAAYSFEFQRFEKSGA